MFSSICSVLVTFCIWDKIYNLLGGTIFGVAQNRIIMGHFTVCQTYYYDEIENIILLVTQRLLSQPPASIISGHLSKGNK